MNQEENGMAQAIIPTIDPQIVSDFQRDGAVHLPSVFSDWLEVLERGGG